MRGGQASERRRKHENPGLDRELDSPGQGKALVRDLNHTAERFASRPKNYIYSVLV